MKETNQKQTANEDPESTVTVRRDTVIRAAYAQYLEAKGGAHPLVLDPETQTLDYIPGGNYHDSDKISAGEIATIEFNPDARSALEAVDFFGNVIDSITIDGTEYAVQVTTY